MEQQYRPLVHSLFSASVALALAFIASPCRGDLVNAIWNSGGGNWSAPGNWNINAVPNNDVTNSYLAFIDGGQAAAAAVQLDTNITVAAVILDSGDSLNIQNNRALTITNSIVNDGMLQISAGANPTQLLAASSLIVSGTGQVLMSDSVNSQFYGFSTLTNGVTHTIRGGGQLGFNSAGIVNRGLIDATGAGYGLHVDPSPAGLVNQGTMRASAGAKLFLENGTYQNAGGVIQAMDSATVQLGGGATVTGGTLTSQGTGKFLAPLNNTAFLNGTILNNATIEVTPANGSYAWLSIGAATMLAGTGQVVMGDSFDSYFYGSGTLTNDVSHTIRGGGQLGLDTTGIINRGLIDATGTAFGLRVDPGGAELLNQGTMQASAGGKLDLRPGVHRNTGLIHISGGGSFNLAADATLVNTSSFRMDAGTTGAISGVYADSATAQTIINGTLTLANVPLVIKGKLAGSGTIGGDATTAAGGVIAPGEGVGQMRVQGDVSFPSGTLQMELASPLSFDKLIVDDQIALGGTLQVQLVNAFAPVVGNTFDLFDATTVSGTFAALQLPPLGGQLGWNTTTLHTSGTLTVANVGFLSGDFNRDGHVNAADISTMLAALSDLNLYQAINNLSDANLLTIGDINSSGALNNADLQSLLNLFASGGGSAESVPEPATAILFAGVVVGLLLPRARRRA